MSEFGKCQHCYLPYEHDVMSGKAPIMAIECQHTLCRMCLINLVDQARSKRGGRKPVVTINCPFCHASRSFHRDTMPNLMACAVLKELADVKKELEDGRAAKRQRTGDSGVVDVDALPDVSNEASLSSAAQQPRVKAEEEEEEDRKPAAVETGRNRTAINNGTSASLRNATSSELPASVPPVASLPTSTSDPARAGHQPLIRPSQADQNQPCDGTRTSSRNTTVDPPIASEHTTENNQEQSSEASIDNEAVKMKLDSWMSGWATSLYSRMNVSQLKNLCSERSISTLGMLEKPEFVKVLVAHDLRQEQCKLFEVMNFWSTAGKPVTCTPRPDRVDRTITAHAMVASADQPLGAPAQTEVQNHDFSTQAASNNPPPPGSSLPSHNLAEANDAHIQNSLDQSLGANESMETSNETAHRADNVNSGHHNEAACRPCGPRRLVPPGQPGVPALRVMPGLPGGVVHPSSCAMSSGANAVRDPDASNRSGGGGSAFGGNSGIYTIGGSSAPQANQMRAFSGAGSRLGGGPSSTSNGESSSGGLMGSLLGGKSTSSATSTSNAKGTDDLTDRRERARKAALARLEKQQHQQQSISNEAEDEASLRRAMAVSSSMENANINTRNAPAGNRQDPVVLDDDVDDVEAQNVQNLQQAIAQSLMQA